MNPLTVAPEQLPNLIARLTPRQMEIIDLLAQGMTAREITHILSISRSAIKWHILRSCRKTGVDNRTQLIVIFVMWKVANGNSHS